MKNVIPLMFLICALLSTNMTSAQESRCQNICKVTREVPRGALIGAMVIPVCREVGLEVVEVLEGSMADAAGLEIGDIIYSLDGYDVQFVRDIKERLLALNPGDEVEIAYLRNSRTYFTHGKLGARELVTMEVEECCDGEFSVQSVNIIPNPTSGIFTLKFEALVRESSISIQLFDFKGQELVVEELLDFKGIYQKEFDISEFGSGVFLIEISNGKQKFTEKVVRTA